MAKIELKLPKMGESVAEATLTSWLKDIGDSIEADEPVLEIATDKVDSEVPSEVDGKLLEKRFEVDDVIKVGEVIAIIETEGEDTDEDSSDDDTGEKEKNTTTEESAKAAEDLMRKAEQTIKPESHDFSEAQRFYSPLVKNIAKEEGVSLNELEQIQGSGKDGRVTKDDMLNYVEQRQSSSPKDMTSSKISAETTPAQPTSTADVETPVNINAEDEVIEMSRMGKLISKHMIHSAQTSAHVQSFIEVDVTNIWNWRNKHKQAFLQREGEKLTFTPIFMEAVVKAIKDFPLINISVDGDNIVKHKHINLGMAAALPDGNLIVPVIHDADQLNLLGMAKKVNDLAGRARQGKLKPDETQGGTYTVTNVGTFGSIMGTPIINQPQVGILALGAIRKVPAVIETSEGDFVGIRHKMFLSHSYDHRVVNGALGGQFVQRVAQYLEGFDRNREV
ncbi:dihydrolipoamide acetyltransferase family protein [Mesohalobacter halotolerans]|uniref:Dihydrolipoamide acetyltransferase component of pyruvate dehydrogenase complex n=1 Tax=Mesohalobacter halotolerans TaxID=1883405 RepID=A0A4U5TP77_9FLAO|nr:dihydrolipoamide acetyltransferase family protein [Mesohalobacter halotolerans]MBS3738908.1 2-oxo acid dehydrogenase subunit E2 [Psychroflexus sp.]TKS55743.1 2-oxo acid dehydrogenase subunit E2 [Mesohalobacter halotolerans]